MGRNSAAGEQIKIKAGKKIAVRPAYLEFGHLRGLRRRSE